VVAPTEIELFSSDLAKADAFLGSAFGWEISEMPEWKMATAKWGTPLTAMVRVKDDQLNAIKQTATFYVTVPDWDKEQKRLEKLGASVFKAKVTIPGMGSWGYLESPGNIIFGLWQNDPKHVPAAKPNTKKVGEDTTVSFFELVSDEAEKTAEFFTKAFKWNFNYTPFGEEKYWYSQGDHKSFSVGLRLPEKSEKGSNFIPFVNVSSIDETTKKVLKLGAKKFAKPRSYGPFGSGSYLTIPGSVTLGLYEDSHSHAHGDGHNGEGEKPVVEEKTAAKQGAKRGRSASATAKTAKKPAKKARK